MSEPVVQFPIGLTGEARVVVGEELTARHMGSGAVRVFATPELVRLMERAAVWRGDRPPGDDLTLVAVRVLPGAPETPPAPPAARPSRS